MITGPHDAVYRLEGRELRAPGRPRYKILFIGALIAATVMALLVGPFFAVWWWAGLRLTATPAAIAAAALLGLTAAHTACSLLSPHYKPTTGAHYWLEQWVNGRRTPRPAAPPVEVAMTQPSRDGSALVLDASVAASIRRSPYDCNPDCPGAQGAG